MRFFIENWQSEAVSSVANHSPYVYSLLDTYVAERERLCIVFGKKSTLYVVCLLGTCTFLCGKKSTACLLNLMLFCQPCLSCLYHLSKFTQI